MDQSEQIPSVCGKQKLRQSQGRRVVEYRGLVVKHLVREEVYELIEVFVGWLNAGKRM